MRGGMYNDALCDDSNGFNKNEMQVCNKSNINASYTGYYIRVNYLVIGHT